MTTMSRRTRQNCVHRVHRLRVDCPTYLGVPECAVAPEIALLVILDRALALTDVALIAANPHLMDQEPRLDEDEAHVLRLAHDLCDHAFELRDLIARYRTAVRLTILRRAGGEDIPF